MLPTTALVFILFVSVSSTSLLRKSLVRRQAEPEYCQAIEGFDCKCSYYRVTCTTARDLPSSLNVLQDAREKYQSVELVVNGERDQHAYEHTFDSIKQLYKPDSDNLEFRIKFEKFTALHLSSPSLFNRVFPDNLPSGARKHMALEIYNPSVQPDDNVNLFANLNVDSLELYVLYPFRGSFQQLFRGANIKYLRLSGGDIRSDLSQPFSGNVGRLELAKQASEISVENFPVYPAHELIINAFYVSKFNSDHPPNYANLGELRIHSQGNIPANAFRQFPNLHTLSISTERDIDPHALDGLQNLEKLTIKDTRPSLELLRNLPNVKEFETSIEKLSEGDQCQLVEKLASGQVAVQAIPNGPHCTCVSAYLDSAAGRHPCDAHDCDRSSCAAIRNNYDASARTFKTPPTIRRSDGTDALRQREARVYTAPFQVSNQDQNKLQEAVPQQAQEPSEQDYEGQEQQRQQQQQSEGVTPASQGKKSRRTKPRTQVTTPNYDQQYYGGQQGQGHPDYNQHAGQQGQGYPDYNQHAGQQGQGYPDYNQHAGQQGQGYPDYNQHAGQHGQGYPNQPYDPSQQQQQPGYPYHPENKYPSDDDYHRYSSNERERGYHSSNNQEDALSEGPTISEESERERSYAVWDYRNDYESDVEITTTTTTTVFSDSLNELTTLNEDATETTTYFDPPKESVDPNASQGETNQETGGEYPSNRDNNENREGEGDSENQQGREGSENQQGGEGSENQQTGEGSENQQGGEGAENQQGGEGSNNNQAEQAGHDDHHPNDPNQSPEAVGGDPTAVPSPGKKRWSWWPIIIIAASIAVLLLIGLIFLIVRKRRGGRGYNPTATSEQGATTAVKA